MTVRPSDEELARLRRHFAIERELANRLRTASDECRPSLYVEVYKELFRRVEMPGNAQAQQAQVALLLQLVEPFLDDDSTFLEVGAGSCDLSIALAQQLPRVLAVDAVEPRIDLGLLPESFSFIPSMRLRGSIPPASVDVALSCHFVEHLHPHDLSGHLREVWDLLAEGGCYIIVTPNRIYGPHDISRHFSETAQGLHLCEYTHTDLVQHLLREGFSDVRVIRQVGEVPRSGGLFVIGLVERIVDALPGGWRRALTARAPRQAPFRPLEQVKLVGFK